MRDHIAPDDVNSTWVKDALQTNADKVSNGTVEHVMAIRFGEKRVIYDPSDKEANSIAMSEGYTVVHGGQLSAPEWDAVRRACAILPAGKVTPSPKPFSPDGTPLKILSPEEWTPEIRRVADYVLGIAPHLIGSEISITIADDPGWKFNACFGKGRITINRAALGDSWFSGSIAEINELLIHELAHDYEEDHFSHGFHSACCQIGGKLSLLALERPELFPLSR